MILGSTMILVDDWVDDWFLILGMIFQKHPNWKLRMIMAGKTNV